MNRVGWSRFALAGGAHLFRRLLPDTQMDGENTLVGKYKNMGTLTPSIQGTVTLASGWLYITLGKECGYDNQGLRAEGVS
uniref:Uncharacterized protein n=1 Tax=Oryza punctata TaxID=4537 RepID=A0A0E0MBR5_ORYPU